MQYLCFQESRGYMYREVGKVCNKAVLEVLQDINHIKYCRIGNDSEHVITPNLPNKKISVKLDSD